MSQESMNPTALVYDFDGTLAPGNIQEHRLIPEYLGTTKDEFWAEVRRRNRAHDADQILIYMQLILERAHEAGKGITREVLKAQAEGAPLFAGVIEWFERIDAYAKTLGLELEHYIVSSANEEMIQGTGIAGRFKKIFASKYIYDGRGHAVWPAAVVNYTTKTQYLFRINKGVDTYWDDEAVNRWSPMEERPIPFERMIYIGDGDTDIPSMKMVRFQGGHSIAVFDPDQWSSGAAQEKAYKLIAEDRAHFVVPADYTERSQLDVTVKGILGRIARASAAPELMAHF
jgi:phosphoserine phosphatase